MKDCHKVFEEQKSRTSDQPPKLKAGLEYVSPGDTLVVTRLDRLARFTLHLCQMADIFQSHLMLNFHPGTLFLTLLTILAILSVLE